MKEINKNICMNCKFFIKTIDGEAFYLCSLPNMFKNECPQNGKPKKGCNYETDKRSYE